MVSLYKKEKNMKEEKSFFFCEMRAQKSLFLERKDEKKKQQKKLMEPIAKKNEKFIKRKICDIAKY